MLSKPASAFSWTFLRARMQRMTLSHLRSMRSFTVNIKCEESPSFAAFLRKIVTLESARWNWLILRAAGKRRGRGGGGAGQTSA